MVMGRAARKMLHDAGMPGSEHVSPFFTPMPARTLATFFAAPTARHDSSCVCLQC